ncbi:Tat pathway signal protein [Roseomonas sp. SSH11]|uniref:Tat pathway signal protein n=1 Tax=Pararoseomonas baculiformis TaxID=2820812 RepID=A0ABS4AHM6_9PROT|nr:Tat pathway signal protein [Pararoseomonas baculiformis]MBP0446526.1 Tat pathway signal protein [Pararoseomonas baculiformis]
MRAMFVAFALLLGLAAAPAEAQNRFWLVNNTGDTIQTAHVSPSRLSNWGPDILGNGVLPAGNRVYVTPNFGDCTLDVRVTFSSGREETRMGLNACSLNTIAFGGGTGAIISGGPGASIAAPRGGNPSFNFVNRSGQTIRELYISLASQSSWGHDRLGNNVMGPGQSVWVDLPGGGSCAADIRVVYANGSASERRGVETCSRTDLVWR